MKKYNINEDWLFYKEGGVSQTVQLPHDAMLYEKRVPDMPEGSASGYFPGGKYIYERNIPGELCGKRVIIEFEGIYRNCEIYLNGEQIGGHNYGYTGFMIDVTDKLKAGKNLLKVIADNSQTQNARWYTGSGIYRNVNLYIGEKSCIAPEQTKIKTLSLSPAKISIECGIVNGEGCNVIAQIKSGKRVIASAEGNECEIELNGVKPWSAESPNMYTLCLLLVKDGQVIDVEETNFGLRTIDWNASDGLLINSKPVKLKGGCIHHDNGILGACSYKKAEYRKIKKLKEAGFNAVRSSHYPAGKDLLEVCDELGVYVMDETFDVWKIPKNTYDYSLNFDADWKSDTDAMVKKDFNHPCVIMYSVGNEITDTGFPFGGAICKMLCNEIKTLDTSRPITCGLNIIMTYLAQKVEKMKQEKEKYFGSQEFNSLAAIQERLNKIADGITAEEIQKSLGEIFSSLDIIGFNYGERYYEKLHALNPDYLFVSTETYPKHICENWQRIKKTPYIIGDFMWTAWDYLGESGVGLPLYGEAVENFVKPYPCLTAYCGAYDLIGNADAQVKYAQIVWGGKEPYIAVRPVAHSGEKCYIGEWRLTDAVNSWDWKGCEGKQAEIAVYNRGDSVELYLDGKLLGRNKTVDYIAPFIIPYQSGELKAIIYKNDKPIGETSICTPSDDLRINAFPEDNAVERGDIVFVDVNLEDESGNLIISKDRQIQVKVENGTLLAFGSAHPCNEQPYYKDTHKTYMGKLLAVIRADRGKLTVSFSAEGVGKKIVEIQVK